jgi:hypothetical protein
MGVSDKDFAAMRDRAASMDLRRQKQIDNQIASINRLLKGGTYDSEMAYLHGQLSRVQSAHAELKDLVASELRGLADSLDESVIADEAQRLAVYDVLVKLRNDVQAMTDGS